MSNQPESQRKHASFFGVLLRLCWALILWWSVWIIVDLDRALPPGWNPFSALLVSDPLTPFSAWRLQRALSSNDACQIALENTAPFVAMDDYNKSEQCHIRGRVSLRAIGQATLKPLETRCVTALRLAMWEHHSLQPAATTIMGASLSGIDHIGSYNCRAIRTSEGNLNRMSTHATADAIVVLSRLRSGLSTHLCSLSFEGQGAFAT